MQTRVSRIGLKPPQPYLPFTKACDSISLLNFVLVKKHKEAEASLAARMTNKHRARTLTKEKFRFSQRKWLCHTSQGLDLMY